MSVDVSPELAAAMLEGSHSSRYIADAYYDGIPTYQNLPLAFAGSISMSSTSRIQSTGRLYIRSDAYVRDGKTLAPSAMRDILAPFGQEIDLRLEISVGADVIGSQSLGRFRITEIPDARETARRLGASKVKDSVELEIVVQDMLESIDANDFDKMTAPTSTSTWAEIQAISPVPVQVSLTDKPLSASTVYTESRLDALYLLARNLGGVLHVTRQGAITVRLEDPLAADPDLVDVDLTGSIKDMSNGMSNRLYNMVVVKTYSSGSQQILAVASINHGPLSVDGPLGPRVYNYPANLDSTAAAARRTAESLLRTVSSSEAKTIKVSCLPDLRVELGDVVRATDPETARVEVGVVKGITYSLDPTALMSVEIQIPRDVIPWA